MNQLIPIGYRAEWSGEFQQMEEGERRLMVIVPLSLALGFHPAVSGLSVGLGRRRGAVQCRGAVVGRHLGTVPDGHEFQHLGCRGLYVDFRRGDHGRPVADLVLQSASRPTGVPLREAILEGAEERVRPVMMTALTAIFGLLPAAISSKIGAQNQKPLAIVVVGSMITTLFLTRYLMPVLYSFYGHREPPADTTGIAE